MREKPKRKAEKMKDPKIGKFDIFATYSYCKGLSQGMADDEAKIYGYVIAVCGAQARRGNPMGGRKINVDASLKQAAEKKKKKTISEADFDKLSAKMGDFWESFLGRINELFRKGYSYDQVKEMANIPKKWGAKLQGSDFLVNTAQ